MRRARVGLAALVALFAGWAGAAEPIKIGVLDTGSGSVSIAKEKGYFAAEGLDAELVRFDAAEPVAVAAVSGAIDFGAAPLTSALYTLATQNAVRLIAGLSEDSSGAHGVGLFVSNKAASDGLRTLDDLPGHSVGLTQLGSPFHYAIGIVAEKHGVDLRSLHFLPLQTLANVAAAVAGGTADVGVLPAPLAQTVTQQGGAKLLAWVGDETPWQVAAVWTSARTANERPKIVEAFLRALRKGSRDDRTSGVDPDNRLDTADIEHQIDWYHGENIVRGEVDPATLIDRRYVVPMPGR